MLAPDSLICLAYSRTKVIAASSTSRAEAGAGVVVILLSLQLLKLRLGPEAGDLVAAQPLWERYQGRLIALARKGSMEAAGALFDRYWPSKVSLSSL